MPVTPMMQQYLNIKEQYPNTILFYRLGDFYEMFFDDAKLVSRELELTLTGKDCGLSERAPMCGVPYHAVDTYLQKLIEKGYKVAICEQMTDPATTKGLVEREVIRVVTPGTVIESSMLEDRKPNYIASLCLRGKQAGCAFCDVSTGEFWLYQIQDARSSLTDELARAFAQRDHRERRGDPRGHRARAGQSGGVPGRRPLRLCRLFKGHGRPFREERRRYGL